VTHQALELWFMVLVGETRRVLTCLEDRAWSRAATRLRRVNAILTAQIAQMETLNHLDPGAFLEFRSFLGSASGFQSTQFRVLEVLTGLRDPDHLARLRAGNGGRLPDPVAQMLTVPSLAQVAARVPDAAGVEDWVTVYAKPDHHGTLLLLGEELLDHDRLWMRWRHEHLRLVERIIGSLMRGTGGASSSYLERRVAQRIFPYLWEVRCKLTTSAEKEGCHVQ
jgi:tryptophan 2,3-dioxygenase